MTTTSTPPPPPPEGPDPGSTRTDDGPRVSRDDLRDLSRLRRTVGAERNIAGVAGGLGRHLDIDPAILRVAFVVLAFFGGAGLFLYGACWLLVPDDRSTRSPLGLDDRSRTVALVIVGGVAALALLGASLGDGFVPFPVIVLAAIALLVIVQVDKRRGDGRTRRAPAPGPATPGTVPAVTADRPPAWSPAPARVDERKRGPILFWFTLALCALGGGVLGTLDLAGVPIPGPAYPGLVVVVTGAMLVLGAFWGRAGGLILVGLLATVTLAGSIAAQEYDGERLTETPTTAAEVRSSYSVDAGELVLDLSRLTDLEALSGGTIDLSGGAGRIEVIVPEDLNVEVSADVAGPGSITVFGNEYGGFYNSQGVNGTPTDTDPLRIDADLGIGHIEIRTDDERTN